MLFNAIMTSENSNILFLHGGSIQMNQTKSVKKNKRSLTTYDIAIISLSTAMITICSWISIPTAVPFTLQTFAIFAIAGIFGMKRSSLAEIIHILLAAVGLPVLAGFKGGFDKIIGPTGGYLLGFIFIALIVGFSSDRFGKRVVPLVLSMLLGLVICYTFGTAWFMVVYARTSGEAGLGTVLGWCVLPFIIPDCIKIGCAVFLTKAVSKYIKN